MSRITANVDSIPIRAFWLDEVDEIKEIVNGLVHRTYLVTVSGKRYILQRVNTYVFKEADKVNDNIQQVSSYVSNDPSFTLKVPKLKKTVDRRLSYQGDEGDYWRCFYFIEGVTRTSLSDNKEAFEVAKAFGQFSAALASLPPESLHFTIQGFHDPDERQIQFQRALAEGNSNRIAICQESINSILDQSWIATKIKNLNLPLKVAHNDPKLSNVLFDQKGGICAVIDLDTVMPGSPLHDFGDLVRSMAASVPEDHADLPAVRIDRKIYTALKEGFLEGAGHTLTESEKLHLNLGAAYIIYEQGLRFLADYIQGDIYYRIDYDDHNLIRAKNQIALLHSFLEAVKA
ncbi:MAG: aminoglycoside phosphotransferase family protein [Saprospiraceae bacterium]|nr:aminoglycoside phosphotransferase family protein [Saprospiraceae bacterium]